MNTMSQPIDLPPALARLCLPPDPAATDALGECMGRHLQPGDVVALVGEVGAGKTSLVRGLARGLGVEDADAVASPTYLLVVEHAGPKPLLHADAYLPAKLAGFLADGGLEYLFQPSAVACVEWADRIQDLVPHGALWVELSVAADGGRNVVFRCAAKEGFPWVRALGENSKPE